MTSRMITMIIISVINVIRNTNCYDNSNGSFSKSKKKSVSDKTLESPGKGEEEEKET